MNGCWILYYFSTSLEILQFFFLWQYIIHYMDWFLKVSLLGWMPLGHDVLISFLAGLDFVVFCYKYFSSVFVKHIDVEFSYNVFFLVVRSDDAVLIKWVGNYFHFLFSGRVSVESVSFFLFFFKFRGTQQWGYWGWSFLCGKVFSYE